MNRPQRPRHSDPIMNAYAVNSDRAMKDFNLDARIHLVAEVVAERILDANRDLHALGGFTKVILEALEQTNPEPDAEPTAFGVPTNDEWYRWGALKDSRDRIRNRAINIMRQQPIGEVSAMPGRRPLGTVVGALLKYLADVDQDPMSAAVGYDPDPTPGAQKIMRAMGWTAKEIEQALDSRLGHRWIHMSGIAQALEGAAR